MHLNAALVGSPLTRRSFLGAGAEAAGLVIAASTLAQQPVPAQRAPGVKGPRVWLEMDQAELDAAYDQSVSAPNLQQIVKRYATNSDIVRARLVLRNVLRTVPRPSRASTCTRPGAPTHGLLGRAILEQMRLPQT